MRAKLIALRWLLSSLAGKHPDPTRVSALCPEHIAWNLKPTPTFSYKSRGLENNHLSNHHRCVWPVPEATCFLEIQTYQRQCSTLFLFLAGDSRRVATAFLLVEPYSVCFCIFVWARSCKVCSVEPAAADGCENALCCFALNCTFAADNDSGCVSGAILLKRDWYIRVLL